MNRQQKEHLIQELKNDLSSSKMAFVVGYKGIPVAKLVSLRRNLQKNDAFLKVAKVTFIRRALDEASQVEGLRPFVADQIALVFARGDSPLVAKTLHNFSKENEKFALIAGYFENKILHADGIKMLASLPSREILLGQLIGLLKAPVTKLAVVLRMISEGKQKSLENSAV